MKKYFVKILSGLAAMAIAVTMTSTLTKADTAPTTITIFHTNDMHGHMLDTYNSSKTLTTIGTDYVVAIRNSVPGSLLVDAGDYSQGMPFANGSKGADAIKLTNAAAYDLGVLGNHEFDFGMDMMYTNVKAADYPILSANTLPK